MAKSRITNFSNSVLTPIFQSATYFFEDTNSVIDYHEWRGQAGRYGRYDNPNWIECEKKISTLDNFEHWLIFPSWMSAITTTLLGLLNTNDHIIVNWKTYRNVRHFCTQQLPHYGIKVDTFELNENYLESILSVYNKDTKVIFIEMPSNPHLYIADIAKIKKSIRNDTILIVDSTLITPINFKPKDHWADLVIHSCGKYIWWHSDILAGSVSWYEKYIEQIRQIRNVLWCIVDPHTAFLLNRSLETLKIRIEFQNNSWLKIAKFLNTHKKISKVYYPWLESHPNHKLAQSIFSGFWGLVSFEIQWTKEDATKFIDSLKIPFMGTNFWWSISMVEQCAIFTYYKQTDAERKNLWISDTLIRLSIWLEDVDILINDLNFALNTFN